MTIISQHLDRRTAPIANDEHAAAHRILLEALAAEAHDAVDAVAIMWSRQLCAVEPSATVARGEWFVDGPTFAGRLSGETTFNGDNSIVGAIGLPFRIDKLHVIDTVMAHVQILANPSAGSHFITTIERNSAADLPARNS